MELPKNQSDLEKFLYGMYQYCIENNLHFEVALLRARDRYIKSLENTIAEEGET